MLKKVLLLNGPPGSGKDTISTHLRQRDYAIQYVEFRFSDLVKDVAHTLAGVTHIKPLHFNSPKIKDSPHKDFPRKIGSAEHFTPREFYIYVSEVLIKPNLGTRFFGERLASQIIAYENATGEDFIAVVPDSGFKAEAEPLGPEFGWDRLLQVRLMRRGKTFEGDSRSYWTHPDIKQVPFDNWGQFEDMNIMIDTQLGKYIT